MLVGKIARWVALAATMLAAVPLCGQTLVRFDVPSSMCVGSQETVSFGYDSIRNIVVGIQQTTMGHSERIFLPDGVACGDMGCSYRSHVNFTAFQPGATITSVQDIQYVRLKIEHSYIGDIYIGITCPNQQKASLMKYSNNGTSECTSSIPSSHRGWLSGNNVSTSTFLGSPYDYEDYSHKCDSTRSSNRPGTGWNYCWSNNTTSGYSYASGDGIIYRSGHSHAGRLDSSNVAAHTNFYHPDQNFSSLIGCPLNGDWYIEVLDGWSGDNGYIFEWDLALNATLVPQYDCVVDSFSVEGYGITMLNDSTFTITAPEQLTHDTTVMYHYHIYSSCQGRDIDTMVALTFHPTYQIEDTVVACEQYVWQGHTFVENMNITTSSPTRYGCDSVYNLHLFIKPAFRLEREATIVENDLPYTFLGRTFDGPVTDTLLEGTTTFGCDSNVTFTLHVIPNTLQVVTDTICDTELPYPWNGREYTASTVDTILLTSTLGADSAVVLILTVMPSKYSDVEETAVENNLPVTFDGVVFLAPADTVFLHTDNYGCDSLTHYRLTVFPNHSYEYSKQVCDNALPVEWMGHTFTHADTLVLNLLDVYGADSTVTLMLTVAPSYSTDIDTTTCDNVPFRFEGQQLTQSDDYQFMMRSSLGCDSVVNIHLTLLPHSEIYIEDTVCASEGYNLGGVSYNHSGIYSSTFTNIYGCDSLVTLRLGLLAEGLEAYVKAIPLMVTPTDPDVRFYDCSQHSASRQWIFGDEEMGNYQSMQHFVYTYPVEADSMPVTLIAYSTEGCADTARTVIHIDRAAVATPNVFTPGKETNGTWQPGLRDILTLEIWIYNRQGELITHLEGLDLQWDGTKNGEPCPQGAYVYTMQYRTIVRPDKLKSLTGTILLLR